MMNYFIKSLESRSLSFYLVKQTKDVFAYVWTSDTGDSMSHHLVMVEWRSISGIERLA